MVRIRERMADAPLNGSLKSSQSIIVALLKLMMKIEIYSI